MSNAFKIANSGRPGPVWIDIPLDVQSKKFFRKKNTSKFIKKNKQLIISDNKIQKTLRMIKVSSRPLILIGNGVHISKAEKKFISFLNKSNIPFLTTWNASDIIPSHNKLYFGRPGLFGNRIANFAIQSCDLLLILGSRLSVPITGYQMKNFSPLSKKIYVEIDKKEIIKRRFKANLNINNDIGIFLEKINKKIKKKIEKKVSWLNSLSKLKIFLDEDNRYEKKIIL